MLEGTRVYNAICNRVCLQVCTHTRIYITIAATNRKAAWLAFPAEAEDASGCRESRSGRRHPETTGAKEEMATAAATVALLAAVAGLGGAQNAEPYKCCGVNEVLDGKGWACVRAPWAAYDIHFTFRGIPSQSLNATWVRRWLPPGLPLSDISTVYPFLKGHLLKRSVPVWSAEELKQNVRVTDDFRTHHVLLSRHRVVRLRPDGGVDYQNHYCVDAALAPFPAPFALRLPPQHCLTGDCVRECCPAAGTDAETDLPWNGYLHNIHGNGTPTCGDDFIRFSDLNDVTTLNCPYGLRTVRVFVGDNAPRASVEGWLSTTTACVDTNKDAKMELVNDGHHYVVQCQHPRVARFVYWLARPLSFVAILLLLVALAAIAAKERMRRSVHGWALASHAACLLAFNATQTAYYLSVSDRVDASWLAIPDDCEEACLAFAFSAYFLLTSAACWLTAVSWNMSTGFKVSALQLSGGERRKFLQLSAFVWGSSILLTVTCISVHLTQRHDRGEHLLWYMPSLLETRTCFREADIRRRGIYNYIRTTNKWGTTVYFYGPLLTLCIANIVCIIRTMRKVQYLRRGSSVLLREAEELQRNQRDNRASHNEKETYEQQERKVSSASQQSQQKSVTIYIKLILSAGVVELTAEAVAWASSWYSDTTNYYDESLTSDFRDQAFPYRTVGYCADVMRAVIVLWLAAPDSRDATALLQCFNPIWRLLKPLWRCLHLRWRRLRSIWRHRGRRFYTVTDT